MPVFVHITQKSSAWENIPSLQHLAEKAVQLVFEDSDLVREKMGEILKTKLFHIDMTLVDQEEMSQINEQYRGKKGSTNGLSFPQFSSVEEMKGHQEILLGDMVLSYTTLKKEAEEQEKLLTNHVTHLIVHGTLHLLGFDHREEKEALQMEALEKRLLAKMGIDNPYEVS